MNSHPNKTRASKRCSKHNEQSTLRARNAPRRMDAHGRPVDQKPIYPGDVFVTASDRHTTGFPSQKAEKFASQWLIDNAVAEAESRGDRFNAQVFAGEKPMAKSGTLPPASVASMQEYLFGWQPAVVPGILRPLILTQAAF